MLAITDVVPGATFQMNGVSYGLQSIEPSADGETGELMEVTLDRYLPGQTDRIYMTVPSDLPVLI